MNITQLTDKELFERCRDYGTKALIWRKKFIGLLPEVNRRQLYKSKGYLSIFEFAAKLCGLSQEQVRLTLNLEKRFEDKPSLKALLVNGEESINKLARIVSIATQENEKELAENIKVLSKSALDTWVKDTKKILASENWVAGKNSNGLGKPFLANKDLPGQNQQFQIAYDVQEEFDELFSKGIDVNQLLREMLKKRQADIDKAKEKIAANIEIATSRYIPVEIKEILKVEHGDKCSISTCKKPSENIHHMQRFSLSQNHDPRFLAPMCKDHHIIAHSIDIKYRRIREATRLTQ